MEGGESYFDWGPWAGTIERCVSVLKDVWNVIYAVGAAIGSALGPAFAMIVEQARVAFTNHRVRSAYPVSGVYRRPLRGARDSEDHARRLGRDRQTARGAFMPDYRKNFFSRLWEGVVADFPDFGKWAEGAGESIKRGFSHAISRVKEKLRGLIDMLPDWVLEKIGWKNEESVTPDAANLLPQQRQQKIYLTCRVKKNDSIQSQHTCHPLKTPILRSPRKCCPPCVGRKHRLKTRCLGVIHICLLPVRPSFRPPHNAPT